MLECVKRQDCVNFSLGWARLPGSPRRHSYRSRRSCRLLWSLSRIEYEVWTAAAHYQTFPAGPQRWSLFMHLSDWHWMPTGDLVALVSGFGVHLPAAVPSRIDLMDGLSLRSTLSDEWNQSRPKIQRSSNDVFKPLIWGQTDAA